MADVSGNGNLDLFVGGRCVPGRYPAAASSLLFRRLGDKFELDAVNTKALASVGMISSAIFSDLDGDSLPELILACEWGPIKIFKNTHGVLTPWDASITISNHPEFTLLHQLTGWWNGVTTGDFDGDGRLDIVASNWGNNTPYESHRAHPLQILYGDVNQDGTTAVIETYFDVPMGKWVPERGMDAMAQALPFLRERFPTHAAYGEAGIEEILGDRLKFVRKLEANWLETTVFLNRGDHFEARPLPREAQLAPCFGVCVGDFDGDGKEDIFLSQNFFAASPGTPRYDAGCGLWLRGDGRGEFSAVSAAESGVRIYGEQRGCALADFDRDGRVDLVVGQNGGATKLYRNTRAKPGLNVRLIGPAANPDAVGACLRVGTGGKFGPAREIHSGSGYWSQDSTAQVLAFSENSDTLSVRWPDGATTTVPLSSQTNQLILHVRDAVSKSAASRRE